VESSDDEDNSVETEAYDKFLKSQPWSHQFTPEDPGAIPGDFIPGNPLTPSVGHDSLCEAFDGAFEKFTRTIRPEEIRFITDEGVAEALEKVDSWDFDIFQLRSCTQDHALVYAGHRIFQRHNFLVDFNIDKDTLISFFGQVEASYPHNPYHNRSHGADVLQAVHTFIMNSPHEVTSKLTSLQKFCVLLAAAVHDIGHTGTTNSFLVSNKSQLALIYNDIHVLESFHCALAFHILSRDQFNILKNFSVEDCAYIRKTIVALILSTDLADHRQYMGLFTSKLLRSGSNRSSLNSTPQSTPRRSRSDTAREFDNEKQVLLMQLFLKSADISHPCREQPVHIKWSSLILEEFFQQGDRERERKQKVSMNMDRSSTDAVQAQIGFVDFLVHPMFVLMSRISSHIERQGTVSSSPLVPKKSTSNTPTTSGPTTPHFGPLPHQQLSNNLSVCLANLHVNHQYWKGLAGAAGTH
jgi:hypothetical protein